MNLTSTILLGLAMLLVTIADLYRVYRLRGRHGLIMEGMSVLMGVSLGIFFLHAWTEYFA